MEQVCDNTSVQSGYGQKKYQRRCQSTASPQDDPFCVQRGSSPPLLLGGAATSLTGCRWAAPPGAHRGPRSGSGTAASVQCDGHQEGQQRQGDHADAGRVRGTSCVRLSDAVYTHIHNLTRRVCCAIIALEHVLARVQERAISRAVPAALAVRHDVPSGGQRARGEAGECNACTGWRLICGGGCGSR